MKDISDVTCLVVDPGGLFLQMALRMAEGCKRVLHFNTDVRPFPSVKQGCIGRGFDQIECVTELVSYRAEVDLYCFPDSSLADTQIDLETRGEAVWGSRRGQDYEQRRKYFLGVLTELGLDVPEFTVCKGLQELIEHLIDIEDQYVKVSYWRGDLETTHWRNWSLDSGWLDWLSVQLGPLKEVMEFLVFPAIETDLEIGADLYCVDGHAPDLMLNGIEGKDKSYFAAVTKRQNMPKQIQGVLDLFLPELAPHRYRNQLSMELRVKGDKAYFNDATQRASMPGTASQHLLWENFPDIVWHGANGILIEPKPRAQFSIEVMITSRAGGHDCWESVEIPEELVPWARFSNCCFHDGLYCFPPDELRTSDLGWLCAIGDTPDETLQRAKDYADMLPDGLNADVESLADVLKEIITADKEGIPFTEKPMPAPESVLE